MADVDSIVQNALRIQAQAGNSDGIYATLGLIPAQAAAMPLIFTPQDVRVDLNDAIAKGKQVFEKFEGALRKAVCDDFKYCSHRTEVDHDLKTFLPGIVGFLLIEIPLHSAAPVWLANLLAAFGLGPGALPTIVATLAAWLLINGCNSLCACTA